jgi:hypothetical protein
MAGVLASVGGALWMAFQMFFGNPMGSELGIPPLGNRTGSGFEAGDGPIVSGRFSEKHEGVHPG